MTTIVSDGVTMASDGLVVHDDIKTTGDKIFEVKGDLIGISGTYSSGLRFVEWYRDKRKEKPSLDEEFEVLILKKNGGMELWDNNLIPMSVGERFAAVGTGKAVALGAIYAGASVTKAVEIACLVDSSSGLPVRYSKIKKRRGRCKAS